MFERKQVDPRDASSKIPSNKTATQIGANTATARVSLELYNGTSPFAPSHGVDNATHNLTIDRLNAKFDTVLLFHADCCAPGWEIWGVEHPNPLRPSTEDKIPITNPNIIVDALVHCIDNTSHREAVHDPDTEYKLTQEVKEYKKLQKVGRLSGQVTTDWEWTVRELERRGGIRTRLRVVEGDARTGKSAEQEMKELMELLSGDVTGSNHSGEKHSL